MCAQCVAQGAAYVVPGLAALRVWSWRRARREVSGEQLRHRDDADADAPVSR